MRVDIGMAFKLNIDPVAAKVFFLVALLQIWNTGYSVYDGYARARAAYPLASEVSPS